MSVEINVQTKFMSDQSEPEDARYTFCYTITIHNHSDVPAKLLSRHWHITNADGYSKEVTGEGVVGEQPTLQPGESFRYTSAAIIDTPVGSMEGSYLMMDDDGRQFHAKIPAFSLAMPDVVH